MTVELDDGSTVEGVPYGRADAEDHGEELDHSGTRRELEIGDTVVETARVRRYCVTRPAERL